MAISFYGSAATGYIDCKPNSVAFVFENSAFSKSKVNIRRLLVQSENISLVSGTNGYMPFFKVSRVTGKSSGGLVVPTKTPFDTALSSDAGVIMRHNAPMFSDPNNELTLTVSVGDTLWQQFIGRRITAAEQQLGSDGNLLPSLVDGCDWVLYPGQMLVVYDVENSGNTGGGLFFILAVWEEDNTYDAGYTVSGKVTLSGSPVTGAKVFVFTDLTTAMPTPTVEVKTTDGNGDWSKALASGVKAAAFVQHDSGSDKYTAPGKPYLEKP